MKPLLLIFSFLCISCGTSNIPNDWDASGLKGNVKSYTQKNYRAVKEGDSWGKGTPKHYFTEHVEFDENGLLESQLLRDKDNLSLDSLVFRRENTHNFETLSFKEGDKKPSRSKVNIISAKKSTFKNYYPSGKLYWEGTSTYKNKRVVKTVLNYHLKIGGTTTKTTTYAYNKRGLLSSQKTTDENGRVSYEKHYTYLKTYENGNWTKRLEYNDDKEKPVTISFRDYKYYK